MIAQEQKINLTLNRLNKRQFDILSANNQINENELYFVTETESIDEKLKHYQLSGNYLSDSTFIPLSTSQLVNDAGFISSLNIDNSSISVSDAILSANRDYLTYGHDYLNTWNNGYLLHSQNEKLFYSRDSQTQITYTISNDTYYYKLNKLSGDTISSSQGSSQTLTSFVINYYLSGTQYIYNVTEDYIDRFHITDKIALSNEVNSQIKSLSSELKIENTENYNNLTNQISTVSSYLSTGIINLSTEFKDDISSLSNSISSSSDKYRGDVWIADTYKHISAYSKLKVIKTDLNTYTNFLSNGNILSNGLYIVDDNKGLNGFGLTVKNVKDPVLSNDAATKHYVDTKKINANGILSSDGNGNYNGLTALQYLSELTASQLTSDLTSFAKVASSIEHLVIEYNQLLKALKNNQV